MKAWTKALEMAIRAQTGEHIRRQGSRRSVLFTVVSLEVNIVFDTELSAP